MSLTLGAVLFEDRFRSIGQHRVLFIVDIGVPLRRAHFDGATGPAGHEADVSTKGDTPSPVSIPHGLEYSAAPLDWN